MVKEVSKTLIEKHAEELIYREQKEEFIIPKYLDSCSLKMHPCTHAHTLALTQVELLLYFRFSFGPCPASLWQAVALTIRPFPLREEERNRGLGPTHRTYILIQGAYPLLPYKTEVCDFFSIAESVYFNDWKRLGVPKDSTA